MQTKPIVVAGGILLAASIAFSGCGGGGEAQAQNEEKPSAPAAATTSSTELAPVGVDAVAKNPKQHAGKVAIEGVVAKVFPDRGAFTMLDVSEFAACGVTTCALYTVPVLVPKDEFTGDLPKEKERVLAVGEIQLADDGYRFLVEEVRREQDVILQRTAATAGERVLLEDYLPSTLLSNRASLALSEGQVKQLNGIHATFAATQSEVLGKISHCQTELVELLEETPTDQAKVAHEKEEIAELKEKLAKAQRTAEDAARAVLTPEQLGAL